MTRELEVKILNIDPEEMEKKIVSLGGRLVAREKQTNTLIDSSERPIKSHMDAYLRIRETKEILSETRSTVLTLKKNFKNRTVRENIELNIDIGDRETMLELLENLGYDRISIGYKERTSYTLMGARLDIDVWDGATYPYPYMEIEVDSEEALKKIVELLEISEDNISRLSIVELKNKLEEELNA